MLKGKMRSFLLSLDLRGDAGDQGEGQSVARQAAGGAAESSGEAPGASESPLSLFRVSSESVRSGSLWRVKSRSATKRFRPRRSRSTGSEPKLCGAPESLPILIVTN